MTATRNDITPGAHALGRQDIRTLALASLGGALEFYDFVIFVFFTAVISKLFFPADMPDWLRQMQTFGIFAAGYLARPLGGIVMAHFGDLLGRKRMFTLSIFLMAIPTLLMGLLPSYAQAGIIAPVALLLLRIVQGAAIGGEVPGAWVFVAEHVPARHVGFACGTLTCGLTAGILLGSLVATLTNSLFNPAEVLSFGWRIPFLLGGAFGLVTMYLRRWLNETPVFVELQQRKALAAELPVKKVVREHRGAVAVSMLLTWMLSAAIVVVILMTPTIMQKLYGIAPATALLANSLATVCLTFGCVVAGASADRFGGGRTLLVGSLGLLLTQYWFYADLNAGSQDFFLEYAVCGFFVGVVGVVPYVMVRAFPADIRFSGLSFSYNVAYAIFGGLTPLIVTGLMTRNHMGPSWYVGALCVVGAVIGLVQTKRGI